MTREQLDAIRARVETARARRPFTHSWNDIAFGHHALEDAETLLAEVERLQAEVEAKVAQNVALIGQNGRLQLEVERLKNELAMAVQVSGELCEKCGWAMKFPEEPCRCELLAKADSVFNRGVQAGREQVISYLGMQAAVFAVNVEQMQKNIRTMQFPEDK